MGDSLVLDDLRRQIARSESGLTSSAQASFTTGHADFDGFLQGGLEQGRLHELYAAEIGDAPSAAGFAAMLALRAKVGPLVWLRTETAEREMGQIYMPGLAELGGNPGSSILMLPPDDKMLLRTAADAAACPALGSLVMEFWGKAPLLTLTASRKLALAAAESGVTLFMLRVGAEPVPSAAATRWRISAAPSIALGADTPGHCMIDVELLRQRGGPAGRRWQMEWDRDAREFREPALSGDMVALAGHRATDPHQHSYRTA